MADKLRNPLAQCLGLVLQWTRDKMGGISSSQIADSLGLAASHYRMIEAGSAILQPSRAIKVIQTFDTIEFVPLCQVMISVQILDSAKQSVEDMRTTVDLLKEANPALGKILDLFGDIWETIENGTPADVSRKIQGLRIDRAMEEFLTTEPVTFTADEIDHFMTPTYQYPISGQLYSKIGNILQGVAPFYLDTVFQLIDNLRNITPRVTPTELARWEASHKNRISYIVGIIRKPEIILDVDTFDYTFLWQESFKKMFIVHRDPPARTTGSVYESIVQQLKQKYETQRARYERVLDIFEKTITDKLTILPVGNGKERIDSLLLHQEVQMNNLWFYFMDNGYVVPFIDNAAIDSTSAGIFGTSLDYDETCAKLVGIRKLCGDIGFSF